MADATDKDNGKTPRKGLWQRSRAQGTAVVVLAVVFGGAAAVGAQVREDKKHESNPPVGAVGVDELALAEKPGIPVTLTVYEDFRSPDSKALSLEYAGLFDELLASGQVQVERRLVTTVDTADGGTGSRAAANAAACAQDQGKFKEYAAELWAAQPDTADDAFSGNARLAEIGWPVEGLDPSKFRSCVDTLVHGGWVDASQKEFASEGFDTVPVIRINDEVLTGALTPDELRTAVQLEIDAAR